MENIKYELEDFEILESIGAGSGGIVFKCRDKTYTKNIVALKKVDLFGKDGTSFERLFRTEYEVHQSLSHKNVVQMLGYFTTPTHGYIALELMDRDLRSLIRSNPGGLPFEQVKSIGKQVLEGMQYCHSKGVLHRDIKTENVLLNEDGVVKLADFGFARDYTRRPFGMLTNEIQTLNYRAPEVLAMQLPFTASADIWSFGCLIAEAISGELFFKARIEYDLCIEFMELLGPPTVAQLPKLPSSFFGRYVKKRNASTDLMTKIPRLASSQDALDLLKAIFKYKPADRPTATELLTYKFFA